MRIGFKTCTFAVTHFVVAFSVTWMLTGSWVLGGIIALVEPAVNTVAYMIHENVWEKIGNRTEGRHSHNKLNSWWHDIGEYGRRYFREYAR